MSENTQGCRTLYKNTANPCPLSYSRNQSLAVGECKVRCIYHGPRAVSRARKTSGSARSDNSAPQSDGRAMCNAPIRINKSPANCSRTVSQGIEETSFRIHPPLVAVRVICGEAVSDWGFFGRPAEVRAGGVSERIYPINPRRGHLLVTRYPRCSSAYLVFSRY